MKQVQFRYIRKIPITDIQKLDYSISEALYYRLDEILNKQYIDKLCEDVYAIVKEHENLDQDVATLRKRKALSKCKLIR